ncbi:hypothetical protein [Streptomyces decoyicus]
MSDTTGIYDDGATYGPDENAADPQDSGGAIYDDGSDYGSANEK